MVKKILRLLFLTILLILAASGIGLSAAIFHNREPYRDKTITIEIVDKKEEDSDNDEAE